MSAETGMPKSILPSVQIVTVLLLTLCQRELQVRIHFVAMFLGYYQAPLQLITPHSELRKVLFLAPSVCVFCLCMKYLGNR